MRTKTIQIFKYDELNDKAKEKARNWYREHAFEEEWWRYEYDDFVAICDILGIELDRKTVKLVGGNTRQDPCIYFRGFSSQGDGASFTGHYSYAKGSAKKIREYAPKDDELHRIVKELFALQKIHAYRLEAKITADGHYCNQYSMKVEDNLYGCEETELTHLFRDLAQWLYRNLEKDYDYRNSDEVVRENIELGEYEFESNGKFVNAE